MRKALALFMDLLQLHHSAAAAGGQKDAAQAEGGVGKKSEGVGKQMGPAEKRHSHYLRCPLRLLLLAASLLLGPALPQPLPPSSPPPPQACCWPPRVC